MKSLLLAVALTAAFASASAEVRINEVLPAPGADWNQDGESSSTLDEWVELVNTGAAPLSLDGYLLTDATGTPRLGLAGSIAPGEHVFLTGEHALDWEGLNGFPAQGLSLNNSGDTVTLRRVDGADTVDVDAWTYDSTGPDVSWGRLPNGTGAFEEADALAGGAGVQPTPGGANGGPAGPKILDFDVSPAFPTDTEAVTVRVLAGDTDGVASALLFWSENGTPQSDLPLSRVDGTDALGPWEVELSPRPAGTVLTLAVRISDGSLVEQTNDREVTIASGASDVVLNEILADPPAELAGDANGDGIRDTSDDEFVELFNGGAAPVDIGGWVLHDATGPRHEFADATVLGPGQLLVVFGGGTPTGIPGLVEVASTGGLSLNNGGDQVRLVGADGVTRDTHAYGSEGNQDESLIRVPDGGAWTRPSSAGYPWAFSPGQSNEGPSSVDDRTWAHVKSLYRE